MAAETNDGGDATGSAGSNSCRGAQQAATKACQDYVRRPEISNFPDESVGSKTLFWTITFTYGPGHSRPSGGNLRGRYEQLGAHWICIKTKSHWHKHCDQSLRICCPAWPAGMCDVSSATCQGFSDFHVLFSSVTTRRPYLHKVTSAYGLFLCRQLRSIAVIGI